MTNTNLKGVKVAILVEDGFEQVELAEPLVSSRKPDDIPAFHRAMIELFSRTHGEARPVA
jgi:hypothetical protein